MKLHSWPSIRPPLLAYPSAPSATVSAALLPPPDPFATWVAEKLSARPPTDQLTNADPDANGLTNLLEYALAQEPLSAAFSSSPLLQVSGLSPCFSSSASFAPAPTLPTRFKPAPPSTPVPGS